MEQFNCYAPGYYSVNKSLSAHINKMSTPVNQHKAVP